MKAILILLFVTIANSTEGIELKQRLNNIQKSQEQLLAKESKVMPLIPVQESIQPILEIQPPIFNTQKHMIDDRVTRLEVEQQYMQKDLDDATKLLRENRDLLTGVIATLETQNKVTAAQTDKAARVDTILNIILGTVTLLAGSGGFIAWKNKHLVFKREEKKPEEKS